MTVGAEGGEAPRVTVGVEEEGRPTAKKGGCSVVLWCASRKDRRLYEYDCYEYQDQMTADSKQLRRPHKYTRDTRVPITSCPFDDTGGCRARVAHHCVLVLDR